ncbi:MAG: hypothetical protein RLO17_08210 [Cyclobacteriaceae bacterium]
MDPFRRFRGTTLTLSPSPKASAAGESFSVGVRLGVARGYPYDLAVHPAHR